MSVVAVEKIKIGSVLLKDVKDRGGRMLLGESVVISERHLQILKAWGVSEADVYNPETDGPAPKKEEVAPVSSTFSKETMQRARAKAMELFRHADMSHEPVAKLYEISLVRIAWELDGRPDHGEG